MAVAATSPAKGVVDVAYVACEGVAFYIQVPLKSAQLAHYSILLSPILKLRNPDLALLAMLLICLVLVVVAALLILERFGQH